MQVTHTIVIALMVVGAAGSLHASPQTTDHQMKGTDTTRGAYAMVVRLTPQRNGRFAVTRVAKYGDREERHTGTVRRNGADNKLYGKLTGRVGAVGALSGASTDQVELWVTRLPNGRIGTTDRSARGTGQAQQWRETTHPGAPTSAPASAPSADRGAPTHAPPPQSRGRHLIGVAKTKLAGKVYDIASLQREFQLGNYLHVGVGVQIDPIKADKLTDEQRANRPRGQAWIRSIVHGGVRVPLNTTIPLGGVALGLGFEAGARVEYKVDDLYPAPAGPVEAVNSLRRIAARTFDLPLNAAEARAMTRGAERVFEGRAHAAISANLSAGGFTHQHGVLLVGVAGRIGGFYRLSGRARISVRRLGGTVVRVSFARGRTRTRHASADLVLGAAINQGALKRELRPQVEYVDQALVESSRFDDAQRAALVGAAEEVMVKTADGLVRKALKVHVRGSVTSSNAKRFSVGYRFELRNAKAREAYERAVRGDFTLAARRTAEADSGVVLDHRVVEGEQTRAFAASIQLSVVFKASFHKSLRLQQLRVRDGRGVTGYEVSDAEKGFETKLFNRERKRDVNLELIRSTRGQSLHFVLEEIDPSTSTREAARFQRLLAHWGLNPATGLPLPEPRTFGSRFGKTQTRVELWLAHDGLTQALAQDRAAFLGAYTRAFTAINNRTPLWATADGRRRIDAAGNDDGLRTEKRELRDARRFADRFEDLAAARSHRDRGKALQALTSGDLVVIAAIVDLAPRSALSVDASLQGRKIQVKDGVRGVAPVTVVDPR